MTDSAVAGGLSGRTAWARNLETPLRQFLRTQTGSAVVLLAAAVSALVWANADLASYERVWHTTLEIRLGHASISQDLQGWLNSGLMAFFFFVVGLEARREFDMGELRERRRLALPVTAGVCGMVIPAAIFIAANAGHHSVHGWGVAMSTDTAFALGMLALVGRSFPDRLRAFMLTVAVVDDLLALLVIAFAYSSNVNVGDVLLAVALFGVALVLHRAGLSSGYGILYLLLAVGAWLALYESGVDPVIVGLAFGLKTYAYPAARPDLERATDLFRLFREQPTAELARSAQIGLQSAISPNLRLQRLYQPWVSYAVVPLFALANAGVHVDGAFLRQAYASPITLGILFGYVLGKPVGVVGGTWLVTRLSRGHLRPPVGWAAVAGGGAIAGIGFTVSLLIADLAFKGTQLEEAKVGVLSAALCASAATWLVFRATRVLPKSMRIRALLGAAEPLIDLAVAVDEERDHVRGPEDASVTLVEYGDFECPFCGRAEGVIRELLADDGDVRYVWRNLPLNDVHPNAQLAAEAAEIAGRQGAFWEMHDRLLAQDDLRPPALVATAGELGLDVDRFTDELREHLGAGRVAEDVDSADLSGVSGTPTFFVNGKRHQGSYDIDALKAAASIARARASVAAPSAVS